MAWPGDDAWLMPVAGATGLAVDGELAPPVPAGPVLDGFAGLGFVAVLAAGDGMAAMCGAPASWGSPPEVAPALAAPAEWVALGRLLAATPPATGPHPASAAVTAITPRAFVDRSAEARRGCGLLP